MDLVLRSDVCEKFNERSVFVSFEEGPVSKDDKGYFATMLSKKSITLVTSGSFTGMKSVENGVGLVALPSQPNML